MQQPEAWFHNEVKAEGYKMKRLTDKKEDFRDEEDQRLSCWENTLEPQTILVTQ